MKTCPYCAEQIQDAAIKCRYCGSLLTDAPPAATSGPTASALEQDVRALLGTGQMIPAIKLVRERTRTGLREAKTYVDAVAAGGHPPTPLAGPPPVPGALGRSVATLLTWVVALAGLVAIWWMVERHGH